MHSDAVISSVSTSLHIQSLDAEWRIHEIQGFSTLLLMKESVDSPANSYVDISIRIEDERRNEVIKMTVPLRVSTCDDSSKTVHSCRLRIDSIFPFVFGSEEPIVCEFEEFFTIVSSDRIYTMQLNFEEKCNSKIDKLFPIRTGTIIVESEIIPVSKELIAIVSPVICIMFYNAQQASDEIGTAENNTFEWLFIVRCLHVKDWSSLTVEKFCNVIDIIHRFSMFSLYSRITSVLMSEEITKEQRKEVVRAADRIPQGFSIVDRICSQLRLEEIITLSREVVNFVSSQTMETLLEASEKSLDRLMLGERKVYVEFKERPRTPKTAYCQLTIRLTKSFDLWRHIPSSYKFLRFANLNETSWSEMKSRYPKVAFDISNISLVQVFEFAE